MLKPDEIKPGDVLQYYNTISVAGEQIEITGRLEVYKVSIASVWMKFYNSKGEYTAGCKERYRKSIVMSGLNSGKYTPLPCPTYS